MHPNRGFHRQRPRTSSMKQSIASVICFHTETVNIWSHLLGTAWFLSSAVHFAATCATPLTYDAVVVFAYLEANTFGFACSALYHVFANHVELSSWLHIDHFGIVCALWAASTSFTLFSFDCSHDERRTYVVLITSIAVICLIRLSEIRPQDIKSRWSRAIFHITLGAVAALPGLRHWYMHGSTQEASLLTEFRTLVILNSLCGVVYVTHLLDKVIGMNLGMPDVSHHVMQVMTVAGAWIYEQGLLSAYWSRVSEAPKPCV